MGFSGFPLFQQWVFLLWNSQSTLTSSRLCFSSLGTLSAGAMSPTMHSAISWTRARRTHLTRQEIITQNYTHYRLLLYTTLELHNNSFFLQPHRGFNAVFSKGNYILPACNRSESKLLVNIQHKYMRMQGKLLAWIKKKSWSLKYHFKRLITLD